MLSVLFCNRPARRGPGFGRAQKRPPLSAGVRRAALTQLKAILCLMTMGRYLALLDVRRRCSISKMVFVFVI